jgi:hypothetical protein
VSDSENRLSQAEIDALSATAGIEKTDVPEDPGTSEAPEAAQPERSKPDRTLSQSEIDNILFGDTEGDVSEPEGAGMSEELSSDEEMATPESPAPPPSRRKSQARTSAKKAAEIPVEEVAEPKAPPPGISTSFSKRRSRKSLPLPKRKPP